MTPDLESGPAEAEAQDLSAASPAKPIESRFLFVDVAAQRAKQLRRGALARLSRDGYRELPRKLERLAMEEVRQGLIEYTLPPEGGAKRDETS
jgi:DNA-directed RNA polymerase subunit K/omega